MDNTLGAVIIMVVAIGAVVVLQMMSARNRARTRIAELSYQHGYDENAAKLLAENEQLRGQIAKQEERLRVLERIATDPAQRISRDIDELQPN